MIPTDFPATERAAKRRKLDDEPQISQPLHPQQSLNQTTLCAQHIQYQHVSSRDQYGCNFEDREQAKSPCSTYSITSPDNDLNSVNVLEAEDGSAECCFGMLCDIPVKIKSSPSLVSRNIPVLLHNQTTLVSRADTESAIFEIQNSTLCEIIGELEAVEEVSTQLYCHSKLDSSSVTQTTNGRRGGRPSQTWLLNIIVYGTDDLAEAMGEFLSNKKMFLQDPCCCERNVLYKNPHIWSPELDEIVMTDSFDLSLGNLKIERRDVGPDLLAKLLEEESELPEAGTPSIICTDLFRHQKQALTFMLRREQGWDLDENSRDMWAKAVDSRGQIKFINNVNGLSQDQAPPNFAGGLLADDMGLGKTLSMICLIAANQACSGLPSPPLTPGELATALPVVKTTLLIVPPSLIQSWDKQLQTHLRPNTLKWYVFHGQSKKEAVSLGKYDVVITTYYTISSIWRKQNRENRNSSPLFSTEWHRIVLDEAHIIQNSQSHLAQACYSLLSSKRWAITGTPIQNKLTDFASIVKFLGVHPYSETWVFEDEISKPWQRGEEHGFLRLKALVRAITIGRTKKVVELPVRIDEIHYLDFSPAERKRYETAEKDTVSLLEAISSGHQGGTFNALQRLNVLRLLCCHGLLAQSSQVRKAALSFNAPPEYWKQSREQELSFGDDDLNGDVLRGSASCYHCGSDLLQDLLEGSPTERISSPEELSGQESKICVSCRSQMSWNEPCQMSQNFTSFLEPPESCISSGPPNPTSGDGTSLPIELMSTKIKALTADLLKHSGTEKSVVFSFWTYTLDLIQLMLNDCGIAYTKIDGKTSLPKRNAALKAFRNDESLRVILVSITCGGAGLDLTSASRAYLLEPHWNPMVEEQALCRVHRVGQKRAVSTIRYLMRNSFEEQVVKLQTRKRILADLCFGQKPVSEAGIGLGMLNYLKSVLG